MEILLSHEEESAACRRNVPRSLRTKSQNYDPLYNMADHETGVYSRGVRKPAFHWHMYLESYRLQTILAPRALCLISAIGEEDIYHQNICSSCLSQPGALPSVLAGCLPRRSHLGPLAS